MHDACPNFRDVGTTINIFAGKPILCAGALFRGGKIDFVDDVRALGEPRLIVNLRRGIDPDLGVSSIQIAADDRLENYETSDPAVLKWLRRVLGAVARSESEVPILIHCAAGRDRTGVAVAAILRVIGIPDELIIADYMMTDGVLDDSQIRTALRGLEGVRDNLREYESVLATKFLVQHAHQT